MPTLYIVATPIGNLEDITLRAVRTLGEVGLIAAEDTRHTRKLLARYDIHTALTSYHEHNRTAKLPSLLAALEEKDVALVTDAGMPCISDPGYELVHGAAEAGIRVVPIPGASAVTSALSVSGLPVGQFIYLGFLPRGKGDRRRLLESVAAELRGLVAFETPHRLRSALQDVLDMLGDRQIAVCRELTKLHEEIYRGPVSKALDKFARPRGEFTLVIEGGQKESVTHSIDEAREMLAQLREQGVGAKESAAQVAQQTGLSRRVVYRLRHEPEPRTEPS